MRTQYIFAIVVALWVAFKFGAMSNEREPRVVIASETPPAPSAVALDLTKPVSRPAPVATELARPAVSAEPTLDVVLGLAVTKESTKYVERFIVSLREYADAKTVALVLCVDAATRDMLASFENSHAVQFFVFDPKAIPAPWGKYHPSNYRYWVYMRWLATLEDGGHTAFRRALLTDVRDTVFQRNPFDVMASAAPRSSLHVFEEVKGRFISQCGWNSGWISDCYHQSLFTSVRDQTILCSGTIMASWDAALAYIRTMYTTLLASSFCERNGIDQGAHNVLMRTAASSLANEVVVHTHESGLVATLGMANAEGVRASYRNGMLYNENNEVYAIAHQVDRHDFLDRSYSDRYRRNS